MKKRVFALAAALSMLGGCSIAYCQHQGDHAPAPAHHCSGVAYVVPAGTTRPSLRKDPAPAPVAPQAPRTVQPVKPTVRPSPVVTKAPHHQVPHHQAPHYHAPQHHAPHHHAPHLDVDLDDC